MTSAENTTKTKSGIVGQELIRVDGRVFGFTLGISFFERFAFRIVVGLVGIA